MHRPEGTEMTVFELVEKVAPKVAADPKADLFEIVAAFDAEAERQGLVRAAEDAFAGLPWSNHFTLGRI